MSRIPVYTHNVSLRISQVLDEIGVNEKIVMKRRKSMLLRESICTLTQQQIDRDMNIHYLGSQVEGTTTKGLHSDLDSLLSVNRYNVIQNWSEWEQIKFNFLMIQEENVSPGYCLLQKLRNDVPLPNVVIDEHSLRDERGRILFKNESINVVGRNELEKHGPAQSQQFGPGLHDIDYVAAFPCQSYPLQARQWLDQHGVGCWPSYDMIQYCYDSGCFVVGVGNKGSVYEDIEWRISTSLAERCLMFNLNITQIRCYVLMKMIMKTFITPQYPESISSFMCKNVLFHCVSNTRADKWKESTLLICLSFCLSTLYNCVLNEHCPHFLIPRNNLMRRRISQEDKPFILEALYHVIESNGRALLEIECDSFGLQLNGFIARNVQLLSTDIAGQLLRDTALEINACYMPLLNELNVLSPRSAVRMLPYIMSKLTNNQHTQLGIKAWKLTAKVICHTMGTILASSYINRRDTLSHMTLSLMSLGLNSDVASGKLKVASIFYCIGDTERTEVILKNVEKCYDTKVIEPICECYVFEHKSIKEEFGSFCYESNQEHTLFKRLTAFCVRFLRCEANCCPYELRYEMFRSTQEDLLYRDENEMWMDMAVVDSLPFLYFLQYKTYSCLGKKAEQRKALIKLWGAIKEEPNIGHMETALNLLGQCFEKENLKEKALELYMFSLRLRWRNNVAKVLICSLISTVVNGRGS